MAINPDTGEYTGNDLERLEEALDKFLCRGPYMQPGGGYALKILTLSYPPSPLNTRISRDTAST